MSDDDDMMYDDYDDDQDQDADNNGGGGDGSDQDQEELSPEDMYYNTKALIEESLDAALAGYQQIVTNDKEKGDKSEWGFKSLKKIIKLTYKEKRYDFVMTTFKSFLTYIKSASIGSNYAEKAIASILDGIQTTDNMEWVMQMYDLALAALKEAKNEKVWFRTYLKLAKLMFAKEEFSKLNKILQALHKSCQLDDGTDDPKKGSQLIDIYALEIQMNTMTNNLKKLKDIYHKALSINTAVPPPLTMGIIKECGGKMHMREKDWAKAHTDFFEAFRNYDEAGSPRRIQCLKYVVLANMLMSSEINPFDSTEAKPYKNEPEIVAMTNLVSAYEHKDISSFEKILRDNKKAIMDDPFIKNYIDDLLTNIRTQVLMKLLRGYTRIGIPFISKELNIPAQAVESLLVMLILDSKISGHIDQVRQLLVLETEKSSSYTKFRALDKWAHQLHSLQGTVLGKVM